jgi:hypothetical protein
MTLARITSVAFVALAAFGCAARPSAQKPAAGPATKATFAGCLLASTEADAAKHPAAPVSRSAPAPTARFSAVAGGVTVEHPLTHACCLTAAVTTRLDGRTAVVTERLSGNPCRCRCDSTIRTELSLPPGGWTVAVELVEDSGTRRVAQQDVTVK